MSNEKKFFDIFGRYSPDSDKRALLESAANVKVKFTRDPLRFEISMELPEHVDYRRLDEIEDELRGTYSALSARILPSFPNEKFTVAHLDEIIHETEKSGVVARGFFFDSDYDYDGTEVSIRVPFLSDGINFLEYASTATVMENIIRARYGVSVRVKISSAFDAAEKVRARMEQNERALRTEILERVRYPQRGSEGGGPAAATQPEGPQLERRTSVKGEHSEAREGDGTVELVGGMTFDISEPVHFFGPDFDIVDVTPLSAVTHPMRRVVLLGEVFAVTEKETRKGDKNNVSVAMSDGTSSVYIRKTESFEGDERFATLGGGDAVAVMGDVVADRQDETELYVNPRGVMRIKKLTRSDNSPEKRVELHLHTNMSSMDSVIRPDEIVKTAIRFGHPALAITDHGNLQAFPEIMLAVKKAKKSGKNLKILYGIEAYFVDDTSKAIYGSDRPSFNEEIVVFDIETTGLSNTNCRITEIGAVKIKGGEVLDRFNTFVNPEVPIPENIVKLTSITDEMVADAPKIDVALRQFLDFIGDRMLVAHNANFDVGFIRFAADQCGYEFHNTYLDTLALSRYLNSEMKSHKLDAMARHYGLGDFNHHRACDDAEMLALVLFKMMDQLKEEGCENFFDVVSVMQEKSDPLQMKPYHMVIIAKNLVGLKNLYRLVSESYLTYFKKQPRMPRSLIERYREGLIIGSACEAGELFTAILDNRSAQDIEDIASFYDYLEIQPLCNNGFLIAKGRASSQRELMDMNRRIVELGKKLGKPVVATCDAHFLNREDEIYRKILLAGMKFSDADNDTGIFFRTTEEMLEEFAYLGEEAAREVVITNTNAIADMVEDILPIPDGTYTPNMEGAEEELTNVCWGNARRLYGEELPSIVSDRLSRELESIIKNGFAVLYMIARKLVVYSESQGYLVGSRGSVGSSFVANMANISEVNPLPPHYRCPKCLHNEFITDGSVGSGFDLPDKVCPLCGQMMECDGHDIPFETFLGFYGEKSPDIDLNFSGDVQGRVHKYTEELFGSENVFRAGTIGTLASKTAYGFVMKYLEAKGISLPRAEVEHLIDRCVGVKRTTGQHPGGIIVVPREYDIYDFTPVQHPADDPNSNIITTHFQFSYLHDTILKLDELGHDIPTKYKVLERYTGKSVMSVKMNDPKVYSLFLSTDALGASNEELGCEVGTYALPEFGTRFIQQVLLDAKPKNFADLLQISGLTHGTNVWLGNAQDLIKNNTCDISQVIGTRDSIMLYLIRYGVEKDISFKIMEDVRKGRGLKPEYEESMIAHGVPDWYIDSCKKIKYLFPKAHAAAYVMSAIRLAWFKIYRPMEFYAAYFTVAPGGFSGEVVMGGRAAIKRTIAEIEGKGKEATQKEADTVTALQIANEALVRGVEFLPVDLVHSDSTAFLPENGKIRLPFTSLDGLGETAAQKIVEARNQSEIFSVEELRMRAGLNKSVIEILSKNGVLSGLSETNQFSFF